MCQARDEAAPERVAGGAHDNGNRRRGPLGGEGGQRPDGHDEVDLETDLLGRELRQPVEPIVRVAGLKDYVLPFDPAQLPKSLGEHRIRLTKRLRTRA